MRWVSLQSIKPNRVLAQSILDERGRILLAGGMVLNPALIDKLKKIGIGSVCIEDSATDDLNSTAFVYTDTRRLMLEATHSVLTELASGSYSRFVRPAKVRKRLVPLLEHVIGEMVQTGSAGTHFGAVYLSDGELFHHSVNVTLFALAVAIHMGIEHEALLDLGVGTLLHDVGKLRIPDGILKKPGKLSADEFEYIKLHTSYGYELLNNCPDLAPQSALIALEHHERFDGTGYPRGLKGTEIDLFGRVTAVVDVYEALTANRVYRSAYLPHQAFELLLGGGGTQFDPTVIEHFIQTIAIYPVGMTLLLSSGYRAVVVRSSERQTQRPVVRVIEDADGAPLDAPWEIDLAKELTIQIVGCEY